MLRWFCTRVTATAIVLTVTVLNPLRYLIGIGGLRFDEVDMHCFLSMYCKFFRGVTVSSDTVQNMHL